MDFDEYLQTVERILILVSDPLDYDCIGGGLILKKYLEASGKNVTVRHPMTLTDAEKKEFKFLPCFDEIEYGDTRELFEDKQIFAARYDAVVFVDGANPRQFFDENVDLPSPNFAVASKRVLVDHHHGSNRALGVLRVLDERVSSTVELILREIVPERALDRDMATLAYAALLGDTGNFRYSVSSATLRLAARLQEKGANHERLVSRLSFSRNPRYQELLAWALGRVKYVPEIATAFLIVTAKDLREQKLTANDLELLKRAFSDEMGRAVEGYSRGIFLREKNNSRVHANIRADAALNKIDLPEMFKALGGVGGGHLNACGFDLRGDLESVENKIKQAVVARLSRNRIDSYA